jgi:hypothetical protein
LIGWDGANKGAIQGVTALGRFYEALLGYSCLKSGIVAFSIFGERNENAGLGPVGKKGVCNLKLKGVLDFTPVSRSVKLTQKNFSKIWGRLAGQTMTKKANNGHNTKNASQGTGS